MWLVGVDGAKGRWMTAWGRGNGPESLQLMDALAGLEAQAAGIAIDVPIGLVDEGPRRAEHELRAWLGPRRSSLFFTPSRPVFESCSYEAAKQLARQRGEPMPSIQVWNIRKYVLEADQWVRTLKSSAGWVSECHPESFFALQAPDLHVAKKSSLEGREIRLQTLRQMWPDTDIERMLIDIPTPLITDALDAMAAYGTAERKHRGQHLSFGSGHEQDAYGTHIQIIV